MVRLYKLNVKRDVDVHSRISFGYFGNDGVDYMLTLPVGFCIWESGEHTAGFDTMRELRLAVKNDVKQCDCADCNPEAAFAIRMAAEQSEILKWLAT
jgi:hypothetical protein